MRRLGSVPQDDEGLDDRSVLAVGPGDRGGFDDVGVAGESVFDLGAGDVPAIVDIHPLPGVGQISAPGGAFPVPAEQLLDETIRRLGADHPCRALRCRPSRKQHSLARPLVRDRDV